VANKRTTRTVPTRRVTPSPSVPVATRTLRPTVPTPKPAPTTPTSVSSSPERGVGHSRTPVNPTVVTLTTRPTVPQSVVVPTGVPQLPRLTTSVLSSKKEVVTPRSTTPPTTSRPQPVGPATVERGGVQPLQEPVAVPRLATRPAPRPTGVLTTGMVTPQVPTTVGRGEGLDRKGLVRKASSSPPLRVSQL
jgi:hypothetical protein